MISEPFRLEIACHLIDWWGQADEGERRPLADTAATTAIRAKMVSRLAQLNVHRFEPDRGTPDRPASCVAAAAFGGVVGPWLGCVLPPPRPPPPPGTRSTRNLPRA